MDENKGMNTNSSQQFPVHRKPDLRSSPNHRPSPAETPIYDPRHGHYNQSMPMPKDDGTTPHGRTNTEPRPGIPTPSMPGPQETHLDGHQLRTQSTDVSQTPSQQSASFLTSNDLNGGPAFGESNGNPTNDDDLPDDSTFLDDNESDDESPVEDDDLFGAIDSERAALAQLKAKEGDSSAQHSNRRRGYTSMQQALTAEYALVADDVPDTVKRIKQLTSQENAELFKDLNDESGNPGSIPTPIDAPDTEVLEEVDSDITPAEADVMLGLIPGGSTDGDIDPVLERLNDELVLPYRDPDDPEPELSDIEKSSLRRIESRATEWIKAEESRSVIPPINATTGHDDEDSGSKYVIHADEDYFLLEDYPDGEFEVTPSTLDDLLNDAIDRGASDIHIAVDRPIKLRINGSLYSFTKYHIMRQADMEALITTAISFISNEKRTYLNQKKSVDTSYTVESGKHAGERFRVHFMDEMNGTAIVMRHIRPQIFTPEEIGLPEDCVKWGDLSQGLILVTGPTGSGKSASLSSILHHIQLTRSKKIITLEEPIETTYPIEGKADVIQREIPENCPSFTAGIRDAMREDPDVILVGEIRDFDTIDAALQASNTGHLTFATIHANSAPAVITRILDLAGADSDKDKLRADLSDQLKGIMSQRLLLKPGNDGRVAVREIVKIGKRQVQQIKDGDIPAMYDDLRARGEDMDSQMIELLLEQRTVLSSVHEACSDRERLDEKISMLPDEWKRRILIDADRSASDDGDSDPDDEWDMLAVED